MSGRRELKLSLAESQGQLCLRTLGWDGSELRCLSALTPAELGCELAVIPSDIAGSLGITVLQPVAGRFLVESGSVLFIPRFPFVPGLRYTLLIGPSVDAWESAERWSVQVPLTAGEPVTTVRRIYPTGGRVPLNLLRLYVQFSGPMSEGWAHRAVRIRCGDSSGELRDVFLVGPELWDTERQRLTLLLDPGRIKRGLAPHDEAGYPLVEGVPVVITVEADFLDADGRPLLRAADVRYDVGPAVRVKGDPKDWRLSQPLAGSTDALAVDFDRPLDHALLEHCLWVEDEAGVPVAGQAAIGLYELSWRFAPEAPWDKAGYALGVDTRLEDLAGNSLARVFDRDLSRSEDAPSPIRRVRVPFRCAIVGTSR